MALIGGEIIWISATMALMAVITAISAIDLALMAGVALMVEGGVMPPKRGLLRCDQGGIERPVCCR